MFCAVSSDSSALGNPGNGGAGAVYYMINQSGLRSEPTMVSHFLGRSITNTSDGAPRRSDRLRVRTFARGGSLEIPSTNFPVQLVRSRASTT